MVRMADKLAENFVSDKTIQEDENFAKMRSRANSKISRISSSSVGKILETDMSSSEPGLFQVIKDANMDGVQHLGARNPITRGLWCAIIVIFIILAMIQIYCQLKLYYSNPVATNIEVKYPEKIAFPVVAICNNNQFRLTYLTGGRIMNRRAKFTNGSLKSVGKESNTVFDTVIENAWDMDAIKFLRNSAHWKSRMILGCTWPNGTACKKGDFKAVWTPTGLCWAINTDRTNPFEVTGAAFGLKLLLNVESYERVDACSKHFRTKSLPGLKILIYNQTDVPESIQNGVNVPTGYSMDIPFRMQHRNKLPGEHCVEETDRNEEAATNFNNPDNVRACVIRTYMEYVERVCKCTMRRAYTDIPTGFPYEGCNVDEYFSCVQPVLAKAIEKGAANTCMPPCKSMDYTAWQDMNRLPQNLMPTLIEDQEEDDEDDVEQDDIDEEQYLGSTSEEETFSCEDSSTLDEKHVKRIKRDAHRAYEKQSRHQEDVFLRSKRLITRLRNAIALLNRLKWGWHKDDFVGVYKRLVANISCFESLSSKHEKLETLLNSLPMISEEKRTSQIFQLLDENWHRSHPTRFKSIGDLKAHFGDKVEDVVTEIQFMLKLIEKFWTLYSESAYLQTMNGDFSRMDRIIELMDQYETNKLQRRVWAEKMQSRQMKHYFEEEFYESFYQPLMKDLDSSLVRIIDEVTSDWGKMQDYIKKGTAAKTGALLLFGDSSRENKKKFAEMMIEMHSCANGTLRQESYRQLKSFKKAYRNLQAAYNKLFKEELPDYLENFEFGHKFVSDNFAMVNIFLHKMHVETWSQEGTYSFWSLACDIGGALGLFLGISLLTIIELFYLLIQHGFCGKRAKAMTCLPLERIFYSVQETSVCQDCLGRTPPRKKSQLYQRRFTLTEDIFPRQPSSEYSFKFDIALTLLRLNLRNKQNIWGAPHGASMSSVNRSEGEPYLDRHHEGLSPPPGYDERTPILLNIPSDEEYDDSDRANEDTNLLTPQAANRDRLTDITEEDSRMSQLSEESKQKEDKKGPPRANSSNWKQKSERDSPNSESVSISEVSETVAPPLFHTRKLPTTDI